MRATDLEVAISVVCPAEVSTPGVAVLNAARLMAMLKDVPEDAITIELQEHNHAVIRSGAAEFKLYGVDPAEFPNERSAASANSVEVSGTEISAAFNRIKEAATTDTTRYILTGIYLEASDGKLRCVATDARRLAFTEITIPRGVKFSCVVPPKAVALVAKGNGIKGTVRIEVGDGVIHFVSGESYIYSKLLDGKFPDYARIIPTRPKAAVLFLKEPLRGAIRRVAAVQIKHQSAVTLAINGENAKISLVTSEVGEYHETQKIGNINNISLTIGINPDHLLDILNSADLAEVPLDFGDETAPIRIDLLPKLYYLMMPVRISGNGAA